MFRSTSHKSCIADVIINQYYFTLIYVRMYMCACVRVCVGVCVYYICMYVRMYILHQTRIIFMEYLSHYTFCLEHMCTFIFGIFYTIHLYVIDDDVVS